MGCANGKQSSAGREHMISLTGKPVKEKNNLEGRFQTHDKGPTPVSFVHDSILINALNREITYRLEQSAAVPKNFESEFLDLRSNDSFQRSHLLFFLTWDTGNEISEQLLKILFDFKNVYLLTDSSEQSGDPTCVSSIQVSFSDNSHEVPRKESLNNHNASQLMSMKQVPNNAKLLIRLFAIKGIKPTSFQIIQSNYSKLSEAFPDYVVDLQTHTRPESNHEQLIGENKILRKTIFPSTQLPLFLYNHELFHLSNNVSPPSQKSAQIFVQSINGFLTNSAQQHAKTYYTVSLGIRQVFIIFQKIDPTRKSFFEKSINVTQFLNDTKSKIKMMNLLFQCISNNENILILRENTKNGFLDALDVFKGMLFEKYCVFVEKIFDYLHVILPKQIVQSNIVKQQLVQNKEIKTDRESRIDDNQSFLSPRKSPSPIRSKQPQPQQIDETLPRVEIFTQLFLRVFETAGKDRVKIEEYKNVLTRLIENLIKNPEDPKYRSFKKDNKTIRETILYYKETPKMLQLSGFFEEELTYSNKLTIKEWTIIIMDIDIAYKNAINIIFP